MTNASDEQTTPARPISSVWRGSPHEHGDSDGRRPECWRRRFREAMRLPRISSSSVDVCAVIDGPDDDATMIVVDPVDDAKVSSARGMKSGQFQM
jgi:hypothetical protein